MRRQLERYGRWLIAIGVLMTVATASGLYIAVKQRAPIPFQDRYTIKAEFAGSSGLNPGLGQAVNVAGVRVGTIGSSTLVNGRSVVELKIDPGKLRHVYRDAQAMLVPNTPLKDMLVELVPGSPRAKPMHAGDTIPVARTNFPIDADELTNALDIDTREFFDTLVASSDQGTRGRGRDLRKLLATLTPTSRQLKELSDALAARRHELKRMVHSLSAVARAAGGKDRELAQVVVSADQTLQALASQESALRRSVARLPSTLATTRATLGHVTSFARELGPTLTDLTPSARKLPKALASTGTLAREATPILRDRLRPLVRELQPLARDLGPASKDLTAVGPGLINAYKVVVYALNELAYNPPGGDDEGYLFWLAWFAHNSASFLSTEDAHGGMWRGLAVVSCDNLADQPALAPVVQLLLGTVPGC